MLEVHEPPSLGWSPWSAHGGLPFTREAGKDVESLSLEGHPNWWSDGGDMHE